MLSFMVFMTLALNACLSELDMLYPDVPCAAGGDQNGFETFLKHHLRKDIPRDLDISKWQKLINKIDTWDRPIQSFFPFSDYNKVIGVCSRGGKKYGGKNLCISKKPFRFFNVEINDKKQVKKVYYEPSEYVILGCNKIENKCQPVHFEANRNGSKPDNNKENCS